MERSTVPWQILKLIAVTIVCSIVVGYGSLVESAGTVAPGHPTGQGRVVLAFTAIVQGAAPGGKEAMPSLHLVQTPAQRTVLMARLSAIDRLRLEVVDLSTSMVIAAFQGLQPTSGYRLDILAVETSSTVLEVTVKRSSPVPSEPVRQGFETPYHVVQVARDALDTHHLASYRLRDVSGDVLKEGAIDTIGTQ